ncbi:hypothetical protein JHFBIEKO_5595 [Methylobacterium mesophilicum]|nr:hypothetical protein JHFBIEKO_5595 [Methylobacterium mesophilicum]
MDQHAIVETRNPRMRLGDPLRLGGGDQDVAQGGQHQRARPTHLRRLHQGQELGGQGPAAEREQLGDDRVGGEIRQRIQHQGAAAREQGWIGRDATRSQGPGEVGPGDVERRQLHQADIAQPHHRGRDAARDQQGVVAGGREGARQSGRAGEMPGAEEMRDRD